jgi:hypothetical protein
MLQRLQIIGYGTTGQVHIETAAPSGLIEITTER